MTRSIAKIVHDLRPSTEAINDVTQVLKQIITLLPKEKAAIDLQDGLQMVNKLNLTILDYLKELEDESTP